jgi:16S rRNA (uracil1498-N3)-methyltransferase
LFDPEAGVEADARIVAIGRTLHCAVGELRSAARVAARGLTLLQAVGKGDKPEQVIRAATALGVEHLVFVESRRAVVRMGDRAESRRARWNTIAVEAARQSGRGDVPRISGPLGLEAAFATLNDARTRRVYLSPRGVLGLAETLAGFCHGEPLAVLIGPEGGLDDDEETSCEEHGFVPVTLGRFILRTEIATVAALGAIAALGGVEPSPP